MHIGFVTHFRPALLRAHFPPGALAAVATLGRLNAPVANLVPPLLAQGHRISIFCAERGVTSPMVLRNGNLSIHIVPHRRKFLLALADMFRAERHALVAAILGQVPAQVSSLKSQVSGLGSPVSSVPDILHAHWTQTGHALAALETGLPVVVTAHDAAGIAATRLLSFRPANILATLFILAYTRRVLKYSPYLIAVVPYVAEHLKKFWHYRGRLCVIPNAVASDPSPQPSAFSRQPFAPTIGDVTAWNRLKNPKALLRAFQRLRQKHPAARLLVWGEGMGPGGPAQAWARQQQCAEQVEFRGVQEHAQVLAALPSLTIFCHTSRVEAQSMALCEAMAAGVPVMASQYTGNAWTLDYGHAGLIIGRVDDPASVAAGMDLLLTQPERRRLIAQAGRERVAKYFAPELIARRHVALYTEILAAKNMPGKSPLIPSTVLLYADIAPPSQRR